MAQVDDLMIVVDGYNGYGITVDGNTNLIVKTTIPPEQRVISDVSIMNSGNSFEFSDLDQDGMIDRWKTYNNKSSFFYGRAKGYPDAVFNEPDATIVRIFEEYFRTQEIDGTKFMQRKSDFVEIELEYVGNLCYP